MSKKLKLLVDQLRFITTIDLLCKASTKLEKSIWLIIGLIGTVWAFYFITLRIVLWNENPAVISKGNIKLSDLEYPAITVCSKGTTKYAIAERLGNFMDPKFGLTEDLRSIRNEILLYVMGLRYYKVTRASSCSNPDTVPKQGCKVSDFYYYSLYSHSSRFGKVMSLKTVVLR